jgi:hypothetical protein
VDFAGVRGHDSRVNTTRDDWPLGELMKRAQGNLSAREMARRSDGRFSQTTWRQLVRGTIRRDGEDLPYRPDPQTVLAAVRVAGIEDEEAALRMAGYDPRSLPIPVGRTVRPAMGVFTDQELLDEVRERMRRGRHGSTPVEDDNVRILHSSKKPSDVDEFAARTIPSFAAERSQADTDQLGEDSQDPGSDEPV